MVSAALEERSHESQCSLFRADESWRVCQGLGERFADVSIVNRVAHHGAGVMLWVF